jgi:hypothetical protein
MSVALSQALAQLNLQPGQCQRIQVNGYEVEIRRLTKVDDDLDNANMLEPWVWFPDPEPVGSLTPKLGNHPLPDPPSIPLEEELE